MMRCLEIVLWLMIPLLCLCKHTPTPVDLSFGYENSTVYYPGGAPFRWTNKRIQENPDGTKYAAFDFELAEHAGTHIDAPYHFKEDGTTVDKIPLHKFFTTGILINATTETGTNSSYILPASKLIEWERVNGEIPENSVVMINFGWAKLHYPDRKHYLGPTDQDLRFPALSIEAAEWIVNTKRVVGVGVDTASPDKPPQAGIHELFANNDMYILENLNISEPMPPKFRVIILPMKLVGGTGGPVRVVAFV
ncbi:kynurenine formamidase-like [Rhodnius prolixus]|uniref:Kynurenine formamidase n=1 Tax=Rhodnius prolixus TaxID=13249 RepID=T1I4D9_RHOPR